MSSNTTRAEMDPILLAELEGAVVYNVPGFEEAFFPLSHDQDKLFEDVSNAGIYNHNAGRWQSWPNSPTEGNVLVFFQSTVDNILLHRLAQNTGYRVYRYVPSSTITIRGGDCKRKTDLLLSTSIPSAPDSPKLNFIALRNNRYDWRSIRVIGELKANPDESNSDSTLAQLANYVREIFNAQPSRRWVHAFTLCGSHLRTWMFDRSKATTSRLIDVNAEPELLLRIICGYAVMDATSVGFDQSIKSGSKDDGVYDPTVAFAIPATSPPYIYASIDNKTVQLEIDPNALFNRRSIVTRGSVCWKARPYQHPPEAPWPYAVKDQWRAAERPSECELISSMQQSRQRKGDVGLPQYMSYGDHIQDGQPVDIVTTVRRDLVSSHGQNATSSMPPPPPIKPKRGNSKCTGSMAAPSTKLVPGSSRGVKRGSAAVELRESSNKRMKRADDFQCDNRVFSRLVMTPVGRAIDTFTSITELLAAMRDAIRGHQMLYNTYQVLHRDVSLFNILIDEDPTRVGKGLLIDLDLAIRRDRLNTTGASHRTGTQDFMAPSLLKGHPHSFRHDLESFFYVLLWIATYYTVPHSAPTTLRSPPPPCTNIFDVCYQQRNFHSMAIMKAGYVESRKKFERECLALLKEDMKEALQPVLLEWRDALYPPGYDIADEPLPPEQEAHLWQRMMATCDDAIDCLTGA
ncbi:hypothetical protein FN846DRAFT_913332 [Sphaerosporella brunnea]|uniref:Protein kinase domain-containing protein n=1 Tax=Sphaerosporella brunnea TaxID=1250544 RepID=A0A5J5EGH5_9PEZI|nr:hypothetical protein FN846DRAFT_913332 [Sphaerosporella brunnea]